MTNFILMTLAISGIIMFLASNLAKTAEPYKEKTSPFECGFNPLYKTRVPFSLQFFLIALIFIIFDVEIILLIPTPLNLFVSLDTTLSVLSLVTILTLGLLHEWNQGSLNWV